LSAGTLGNSGSAIAQTAAHGILGGAVNEAMGGKFQDGFLSAAAGKAATFMPGVGQFLDPDSGQGNILSRTAVAATIGGTASALGGGKFANGAYTAAMQHLFNEELDGWRNRVIENAVADSSYSLEGTGPQGNWRKLQYKCNAFVFDVLKKAGLKPVLEVAVNGRLVPQAGDWANKETSISAIENGKVIGRWAVTDTPKVGDVAAMASPGQSNGIPYSGHVGIIVKTTQEFYGTQHHIMAAHETGSYISADDALANSNNAITYRTFKP
jgi:hypothetical protein